MSKMARNRNTEQCETTTEECYICGLENKFPADFKIHECVRCGTKLLPCKMCYDDTVNCKLCDFREE